MIGLENYEAYFVDYLDHQLNSREEEELFEFLEKNPSLYEELEQYKLTFLVPDEALVYPFKDGLKRAKGKSRILPFLIFIPSIAALLVLALILPGLLRQEKPDESARLKKPKSEQVTQISEDSSDTVTQSPGASVQQRKQTDHEVLSEKLNEVAQLSSDKVEVNISPTETPKSNRLVHAGEEQIQPLNKGNSTIAEQANPERLREEVNFVKLIPISYNQIPNSGVELVLAGQKLINFPEDPFDEAIASVDFKESDTPGLFRRMLGQIRETSMVIPEEPVFKTLKRDDPGEIAEGQVVSFEIGDFSYYSIKQKKSK